MRESSFYGLTSGRARDNPTSLNTEEFRKDGVIRLLLSRVVTFVYHQTLPTDLQQRRHVLPPTALASPDKNIGLGLALADRPRVQALHVPLLRLMAESYS